VIVAVIPARGGSKRIPRKNIRQFAGKPMIAHSIVTALSSKLFDRVIVSTDDAEISQVARAFGAEVPFVRPSELSGDRTNTADVIAHAVKHLVDEGTAPSAICCIYATAPFIRREDLERGLTLLEAGPTLYVFSATTFPAPIFRSFRETARGNLEMFFPEHYETRSQDLPEALHDAGQFYWGRPEAWLNKTNVFGAFSQVVKIPRSRVQDIDTEEDWVQAESMAAILGICDDPAGRVRHDKGALDKSVRQSGSVPSMIGATAK
jgi:pseudaminic acid cytidylyltransferase